MKRIALAVGFAVLTLMVSIWGEVATPRFGLWRENVEESKWTPEQQEPLDAFTGYIKAASQNNIKEVKTYWHPNIVGWDLKQDSPMDYSDFLKAEEDFFKEIKFKKIEFTPLAIQVEGKCAIIHLKYDDVFADLAGKEMSSSGNWTVVMVKLDKKWVILSNVWAEK